MYFEILNDDLVGFTNTTCRDMLDHLFLSYGSITAVDIEQNFENMHKAWNPQQPVETLFNQIQDCFDFAEAGWVALGAAQTFLCLLQNFQVRKIQQCLLQMGWKTWGWQDLEQFQDSFCGCLSTAQTSAGRECGAQGFDNAAVTQASEDDLAEQALVALANLATATAVDRGVVVQLTEANSRLANQLEHNATSLKEVKALLKKERVERAKGGNS
jgi:hypothetical protein